MIYTISKPAADCKISFLLSSRPPSLSAAVSYIPHTAPKKRSPCLRRGEHRVISHSRRNPLSILPERNVRAMIEISHLSKQYISPSREEIRALDDVSVHIQKGDIFGIIGMSGAGKSTLLRCIGLLEPPSQGKILIDGADVTSLKGKKLIQLRRSIGIIFQGYNLLMQRTVAGNVAFPMELTGVPKAQREARVRELLELVGLSDRARMYPSQLSGGQKQRVAIARALANHSKVLLCDEPTSALDSLTTQSILGLLRDINERLGVTIVVITHEIGVVRAICNRVAVIDSSRFVEEGPAQQVLEHPQNRVTRMLLGMKEEL